jgi:predicted nucleotidyltransferase
MEAACGLTVPTEPIAELCRRYGVKEMSLFGSAARGEMTASSDVDIVVDFLPGTLIGLEFFTFEQELAKVFGRKVDLVSRHGVKPRIWRHIERDLQPIYVA